MSAADNGELITALDEWIDAEVDRKRAWDAYLLTRDHDATVPNHHYDAASDATIRKGTAERHFQRAFAAVAERRAAERQP